MTPFGRRRLADFGRMVLVQARRWRAFNRNIISAGKLARPEPGRGRLVFLGLQARGHRPRHAGKVRRLQGEGAERGGLAARSTKEVAHLLRPIRLEAPAPLGRHLQAKAKCPRRRAEGTVLQAQSMARAPLCSKPLVSTQSPAATLLRSIGSSIVATIVASS